VMVAILVLVIKLPEIDEAKANQVEHTIQEAEKGNKHYKSVFQYKHFLWSAIALLTYLVAQFGITGFFVTYVVDTLKSMKDVGSETLIGIVHFFDSSIDLTDSTNYNKAAVVLLSMVSMGLFMLGRFIGSLLLLKIKPQKLLCMSAVISIILTGLVVANNGMLAIASLIALFLFMSSMFPIIFTLGLKNLGAHTKKASAYLVMTIGGAAFLAFTCMDYINIITGTSNYSFIIPFICFIVVFIFGRFGYKTEI
jgi:FHS family L-fucose permease-like MFS transporter